MLQKIRNFAAQLGLPLSLAQAGQLCTYAQCVWDKKDTLNLTSAADFNEVIERHIFDGLTAAWQIAQICKGNPPPQLADAGAGCGYIGMSVAAALPQAHVTLIESLERRCKFMNWAALTAGITNVRIKNTRLGQGTHFAFDVLTERAMGQLPDIFDICMDAVKPGGVFMAFQGEHPQTAHVSSGVWKEQVYHLPCDNTPRYLVLFKKDDA
ncbi:MAG: class I SAM-dependent methyltransferase [Elusimicrobiaceae bacterium]|nr:class I SAM-dependent methyltransferase [Elusimicrobiaceae bacterium]